MAREAAAEGVASFPGLAVAERLYQQLADTGHGDEGTQALWVHYASAEPPPCGGLRIASGDRS